MGELSLRAVAVAGLVAAGLLVAGPVAVPAVAAPADSGGGSQGTDSSGSDGDGTDGNAGSSNDGSASNDGSGSGGSDGSTGTTGSADSEPDDLDQDDPIEGIAGWAGEPDEPATQSGGVVAEVEPPDDELSAPAVDTDSEWRGSRSGLLPSSHTPQPFEYSNSLSIPVPRLPAPGEIPPGTLPTLSSFYTTVDVPLPTLGEFLQSLAIYPTPAPPGPTIRTQEEEPVLDAATGTAAGGGGAGMSGMSEAPAMRAPLVVAVPRAVTVGGQGGRPVTPATAPAPGVTQPGTAGVRSPVIRGSLPPSADTAPQSGLMNSLTGPSARLGYPRGLSNPTVAELAAVALPGVAGLILVTFGGGVIGYRQANSARFVRTPGAERFLR